jgi:prolyl oligopeptidase
LLLAWPVLAEPLSYPKTEKVPHTDTYFDQKVEDPYHWLEDDRSPRTAAWVKAENKVTQAFLEGIPFRDALKARLRDLMNYERISAPFREGDWEYFYKNDGLQNHAVLYRSRIGGQGQAEVFLDPNSFSADGTVGLRGISFSKDGSLAAYQVTEGGSDWRKVHVIDTRTKKLLDAPLEDVKFSDLSWHNDDGFYYSSYPNPDKDSGSQLSSKTTNHRLMWHRLGTPQSEDVKVFGGDERPTRYLGGSVTEDQRYLVVSASQTTSGSQIHILDLEDPKGEYVAVSEDYDADCSVITNDGSRFFMKTNIGAPNYRVVCFDLARPKQWHDVIAESKNVLTSVSSGGKNLFATYLADAKSEVKQYDLEGKLLRRIALPGIGSVAGFAAKEQEKDLYYSFASFTTPSTIFHYDIASGKSTLYRRPKVDFDPQAYTVKQVFYPSKDGTRIPMFIVHRKDLEMDGNNPTILYGYGGFNISLTPSFSSSRIAWLEQGGVYAVANLRGGGEYGETWHQAGTKLHKQNVFDDFIAAGEYLIDNGYTSHQRLAISGGSNGGLLVGATMTQRPDLAGVALPAVGVMDMLRYHTFTAGAGWAADYGTAEDSPEMFAYLRGYSPYEALKPGTSYPATLITTADHDDRVVPAHSFKFAARLQECQAGPDPVLIRIQTRAGHGVVSTEQQIALDADVYSFVWANMGLTPRL